MYSIILITLLLEFTIRVYYSKLSAILALWYKGKINNFLSVYHTDKKTISRNAGSHLSAFLFKKKGGYLVMREGDIVYFAKEYRDPLPGVNILVRAEGTFYFNQVPPKGVNYVVGRLSRMRGNGVSIGIYDYFMNFDSSEVWNCHNEQPITGSQVERNFKSCIDSNTIVCSSLQEARILSQKCHEQGISCNIQGRMLTNVSDITVAREFLDMMNPKGKCIYQALPTGKFNNIEDDDIEDNFEI